MAILMCRPDHFGVEYEINPWMHVERKPDAARASAQWEALHATYLELGVQVELIEQVKGLPDMVFTANAGVIRGDRAVLSRFKHPERQGEEPFFAEFFTSHGYRLSTMPDDIAFEGAGDALFVGDRLFCGHGFRTDRESHAMVGRMLDVEVVSLHLVNPDFYHLDTCFCPISDSLVMFAPHAFTPESARLVRQLVPHVLEVPPEVAAGFACNAITIGTRVISSLTLAEMSAGLLQAGFTTTTLPVDEFLKAGGGVRCLSLPLN